MTAAEWLVEVKARNTPSEIAAGTPSRDIFTFREGEVGFVMAAGWARASADVRVLVAAIEAVLALHQPVWCNDRNGYHCDECGTDLTDATPDCPTVAAIAAHLDPS